MDVKSIIYIWKTLVMIVCIFHLCFFFILWSSFCFIFSNCNHVKNAYVWNKWFKCFFYYSNCDLTLCADHDDYLHHFTVRLQLLPEVHGPYWSVRNRATRGWGMWPQYGGRHCWVCWEYQYIYILIFFYIFINWSF